MLEKLRGKGLCVSLLFDPTTKQWSDSSSDINSSTCAQPHLPAKVCIQSTLTEFKKSLQVSPAQICEIECNTRTQRNTPLWFSVHRYRLTASNFGDVRSRTLNTRPDSLVLRILGVTTFNSKQVEYGRMYEETAREEYVKYQNLNEHAGLYYVCEAGFHIDESFPFLGASPDGSVYDPTEASIRFSEN